MSSSSATSLIRVALAFLVTATLVVTGVRASSAQTAASPALAGRTLVIGTKEAPPFAIREPDGSWSGISIELWETVARRLGATTEWRDLVGVAPLLDSIEAGRLDGAVAAITITADREARLDFSQPFHVTGLGIAVAAERRSGWSRVLRRFLSGDFLRIIGALLLLLTIVGGAIWLFERRTNAEQFGGGPARGIGTGIWWSAVTMSTVGYGDKAPRTLPGRLLAIFWMFTALIIVSSFTAAITSALTIGELEGIVRGPEDLPSVRVGTVQGSTSAAYLIGRHVKFDQFPSALEALRALANGRLDAVVYDAPILKYEVNRELLGSVRVLPATFETQYYGIAFPTGSTLREPVSRAVLASIHTDEWRRILTRYLGE